jgi:nicotinamide riboside kinase
MSTSLGRIASFYYISHKTICMFDQKLHVDCTPYDVIQILSSATEYDELPVRHNEDNLNRQVFQNLMVIKTRFLNGPKLTRIVNFFLRGFLIGN